jgi:hypothetical protein
MTIVNCNGGLALAQPVEVLLVDAYETGDLLQFAVRVFTAGEAIAMMIGHDQFNRNAPRLCDQRGLGVYFHAFRHRGRARGRQAPHALDFDDAKAASAVWLEVRVITEPGDIDTGLQSSFQHGHSSGNFDPFPINDYEYFFSYIGFSLAYHRILSTSRRRIVELRIPENG